MPIYEFHCQGCNGKVEVFRRSMNSDAPLRCRSWGGGDLRRLVSRFSVGRANAVFGSADEERYLDGLDDEDPRAMAAWARRMAQESGEPLDADFERMIS